MMQVWLLMVYVGGYAGYVTVPDLPNQEECIKLGNQITKDVQHSFGSRVEPRCYSYLKAPTAPSKDL